MAVTGRVLYDVEAWTDMFPEFGGDSSAQTDNFMTKRASGLATYRNTDFFGVIDGLNLTLQYQGKNENRDVKKQNGDGFGTSLTYDFGGSDFAISGAYTNSYRTNEQNLQSRGTGKRAEAWATGLNTMPIIFIWQLFILKHANDANNWRLCQ
ncbi:porin [Escherichia coli]